MRADYRELSKTIAALTEGESDEVSLMATVVVNFTTRTIDLTGPGFIGSRSPTF